MKNKTIAGYVYFIQGGINPKMIFLKALGVVIAKKQKWGNTIVGKIDEIRNAYHGEYKVFLPNSAIKIMLEENFEIINNKYEYKKGLGLTVDGVSIEIEKDKVRFEAKLNDLKKTYSNYYKSLYPDATKQIINDSFLNCILDEPNDNSEYDVDEAEFSNKNVRLLFLRYLLKEKNDLYDIIENITIANAIADVPIDVYDFSYNNCIFYLDTPILMKYLGYDGIEYRNLYCDIINSLRGMGISFFVFEHTFEETWGILFQWKLALEKNYFLAKGLDVYLKAKKYYKDNFDNYIPLTREGLSKVILNSGIKIAPKPNVSKENVLYDEKEIISLFEERYKTTYDSFPDRINKDVDSITGIQSLRIADGIEKPNTHEEAKYFILTDNKQYFEIANINYRKNNEDVISSKAFCEVQYNDYVILNLWQKAGKRILPEDLFKARILSSNLITKDFRQDFLILLNRMTQIEGIDLLRMIKEYPEVLHQAAINYNESNHSVEDLISFLKNEWGKKYNKLNNIIVENPNEKEINNETVSNNIQKIIDKNISEFDRKEKALEERERLVEERENELNNMSIFKLIFILLKKILGRK